MTVCNMSIEGGARAGMVAPDDKTFAYLEGKPRAPKAEAFDQAVAYWRGLYTDEGAHWDKEVRLDAGNLSPIVSWGTSPQDVITVAGTVPHADDAPDESKRAAIAPRARLHGPEGRRADHRHRARQGVHRLVHQQPHRGPARRRRHRRRPQRWPSGSRPWWCRARAW